MENVEHGAHRFDVFHQPGCTVGLILADGEPLPERGAQVVTVLARPSFKSGTIFIHVYCE